MTATTAGLTTRDVARRFRVSEDKVRAWIRTGQLTAINTSNVRCARPRFVVTPEALAAFEAARAAAPKVVLASTPKRRQQGRDFYPD